MRSDGVELLDGGGTISDMIRAPWLPPNTSRRTSPSASGATNGVAAAAIAAGRTGLPVRVALAASAGSASSTPANEVAIAVTRGASCRLARPITAFCSWMMVGISSTRRRADRRQRRIAAEADHGGGLDPAQHEIGAHQAAAERQRGARERDRIACAHGVARDDVGLARREASAIALGAVIGGKIDRHAALGERRRQRLGGKQMSAGSAGREQHERRAARVGHAGAPGGNEAVARGLAQHSRVRGRSRVSASSMPMPQASEIIEEPP